MRGCEQAIVQDAWKTGGMESAIYTTWLQTFSSVLSGPGVTCTVMERWKGTLNLRTWSLPPEEVITLRILALSLGDRGFEDCFQSLEKELCDIE